MRSDLRQLASRYLYGTTLAFVTTGLIVHGLNTWTNEFFEVHGERIFTFHWTLAAVVFVAARAVSLFAPQRAHRDYLDGYVGGLLLVAFVVHTAHASGVGGPHGAEIFASMHWGTAFLAMTAATFLRIAAPTGPFVPVPTAARIGFLATRTAKPSGSEDAGGDPQAPRAP